MQVNDCLFVSVNLYDSKTRVRGKNNGGNVVVPRVARATKDGNTAAFAMKGVSGMHSLMRPDQVPELVVGEKICYCFFGEKISSVTSSVGQETMRW